MTTDRWRVLLGAAPAALILLFFVLPLVEVVRFGLLSDAAGDTAAAAASLWQEAYHRNRILFTFQQAILSTVVTLLVGLPLAYVFAHYAFPGRRVLRALFTAPFVLPAIVAAVALQAFLGRASVLASVAGGDPLFAFGPLGAIVIAHVYYNLSIVLRLVGGFLERVPTELDQAARTLGADRWRAFLRVQLPIAAPAVLASAALVFLFSLTSFGIIVLLGGGAVGTVETLIWDNVRSLVADYRRAALLGVLQLATTLAALLLYIHFQRRAQATFRPRTEGSRPQLPVLGWLLVAPAAIFLIGPSFALAIAAFTHQGRWSLEGVRLLVGNEFPLGSYHIGDALANSLIFGVATLLVSLAFAALTLLSLPALRRLGALTESFLLSPLGASPVLLGLGLLLTLDGQPLWDLRAHPVRILIVHALVAFPFVTRILSPAFHAIDPGLHESARTLGATPQQSFLRVDLPLLLPALRLSAIFAFAISLGEFGGTLLLRRPEFTTIPLAIFDALARPGPAYHAQAEVLAFLLLFVATAAFWLLERGPRTSGGEFA